MRVIITSKTVRIVLNGISSAVMIKTAMATANSIQMAAIKIVKLSGINPHLNQSFMQSPTLFRITRAGLNIVSLEVGLLLTHI